MDMLIAAHAISLGAILVTNNMAHFSRIKSLQIDNWVQIIWLFDWVHVLFYLAQKRHDNQGDDTHQLDQDVHGGAWGIFERVAYGVAGNCGFVGRCPFGFAGNLTLLDCFLGVVPGAAGIVLNSALILWPFPISMFEYFYFANFGQPFSVSSVLTAKKYMIYIHHIIPMKVLSAVSSIMAPCGLRSAGFLLPTFEEETHGK